VTAFGVPRTAQLPVMDHRNKAIANPDAFQVNTAMQRCLAKAIALHGIGLYIYAGEDLPEGATEAPKAFSDIKAPSHKPVAHDAWDALSADEQTWLNDIADGVRLVLSTKGGAAAIATLEEQGLSADHKVAIWSRFASHERSAMKKKEAA
jgi:hypothetical protein